MNPRVGISLTLGVLCVSWASIFVRLADAPPLTVAAWRLSFAGLPVGLYALARHRPELAALGRRRGLLLVLGGVALALHFGTWIFSLSLTSIASSTALVTTTPIWVAILERPPRRTIIGMAIALAGSVLIAGTDFSADASGLRGDALALAGAIFGAAYLTIGKRLRNELPLAAYVGVVYPVAGLCLMAAAVATASPLLHLSAPTWLWLVLLAAVPQLLGHSLLNWSLRHTTAALVAIAVLGEPIFATLLAVPVLHEVPGVQRVIGDVVVIAGVALASTSSPARAPAV